MDIRRFLVPVSAQQSLLNAEPQEKKPEPSATSNKAPVKLDPSLALVKQSQRSLAKGDAVEAERIASQALARFPDNVQLYRARIAALAKQNKFKQVLDDAWRIVRLQPDKAKGYLLVTRTLERLDGGLNAAYQVLDDHLSKFPLTDPDYRSVMERLNMLSQQLFQRDHQKASAYLKATEMIPKKRSNECTDPLEMLPYEVIFCVISMLGLTDRLRLVGVKRTWQTFLEREPRFWKQLDLSVISQRVNNQTLQALGSRAKSYLESLNVSRCRKINDSGLKQLLHHRCYALQSFSMSECHQLSLDGIVSFMRKLEQMSMVYRETPMQLDHLDLSWTAVTDDQLGQLLKICTRLRSLNIGGCKKLSSCFLNGLEKHGIQVLHMAETDLDHHFLARFLAKSAPNHPLKELVARDCPGLNRNIFSVLGEKMEVLNVVNCNMLAPPTIRLEDAFLDFGSRAQENLKEFQMTNVQGSLAVALDRLTVLCPQISTLNLSRSVELCDESMKAIAENLGSHLRVLNLDQCISLTNITLQHLAKYCPNLSEFILTGASISDSGLLTLGAGCRSLQLIEINSSRLVSGAGVLALLCGNNQKRISSKSLRLKRLRELGIDFCKNVRVEDVQSIRAVMKRQPQFQLRCRLA